MYLPTAYSYEIYVLLLWSMAYTDCTLLRVLLAFARYGVSTIESEVAEDREVF